MNQYKKYYRMDLKFVLDDDEVKLVLEGYGRRCVVVVWGKGEIGAIEGKKSYDCE